MSLMDQFKDPNLMHSLSFGDKMAGAGMTTLMGMGTTFAILILLWGIIALMNRIVLAAETKAAGTAAAAPAAPAPAAAARETASPQPAPAAAAAVGSESGPPAAAEPGLDEAELAAVIAAAIAAYEGEDVVRTDLVVRRIRRVAGSSPAWAREGLQECIDSRRR
ncbi:MAG: OadG family protein [Anaerovoracaceae bacterium]|jgi:Na+-transporting methylmalonyl-CoA/oxaloacetate decarboxylase gamma subunit